MQLDAGAVSSRSAAVGRSPNRGIECGKTGWGTVIGADCWAKKGGATEACAVTLSRGPGSPAAP